MKLLENVKIPSGIILLALFFSFSASALECYNGNIIDEGEGIGVLVLLTGTQNGSRVWESREYTRDITCTTKINENVYFYPFPKIKSEAMPKGVRMGLIYNGKDLGTFDEDSGNGNRNTKVDTGWNLNKNTATRSFKIKAYLVKTGEIDTSMSLGAIHLFQLDGVNGLNNATNARNYKFNLSQWNQTGMVNCTNSISNMSFSIPVNTDQSVAASTTHIIDPVELNISCTSGSAGLANLLSSITGNFTLSGTTMANRSDHYSSDRESFGFAASHKGESLTQGKQLSLTIPLSGGKAKYPLPLGFTPRLDGLKLNSPAWIFKDSETQVKTKITPIFSPLSVSTN